MTCIASDVIQLGHGNCCGKAHLLAAMLRVCGIPTGFCYQKLCSDESEDRKIIHGLNAIYLEEHQKWIRVDARGNEEGVDAQFCIDEEKLAWPVRRNLGEEDCRIIYIAPHPKVIAVFKKCKNKQALQKFWEGLANINLVL